LPSLLRRGVLSGEEPADCVDETIELLAADVVAGAAQAHYPQRGQQLHGLLSGLGSRSP
jgi:hypothetical protein